MRGHAGQEQGHQCSWGEIVLCGWAALTGVVWKAQELRKIVGPKSWNAIPTSVISMVLLRDNIMEIAR